MRKAVSAILLAGLAIAARPANASNDYPRQPIRIINASSAGGASDIFVRALSEEIQKTLKQPFIVENRPGGAFNIAIRACAESAPDGYTFCVLPSEAMIFNPHLFKNLALDIDKTIVPVMNLFFLPQVLAVRADMGIKSVDELAAASKAKPGTFSYTSPGIAHVAFVETFIKGQKGGDMVKVPFKGGGDAVNGMLTGTTPVAFVGVANLKGLLESNSVVGLAVDTEERIPSLPNGPTLREVGYTGVMVQPFFALFAPARTPENMIGVVRSAVTQALGNEAFVKRNVVDRSLLKTDPAPERLRKLIADGKASAEKIINEAKITMQ
jgi:tripartite-type tricarboxylate transporter receptor subunit TctC